MGEGRRAFGLFLTHVLKRVSSPCNELGVQHAALVLRFLRRASASLRMPYNVKVTPLSMPALLTAHTYTLLHMSELHTNTCTDTDITNILDVTSNVWVLYIM